MNFPSSFLLSHGRDELSELSAPKLSGWLVCMRKKNCLAEWGGVVLNCLSWRFLVWMLLKCVRLEWSRELEIHPASHPSLSHTHTNIHASFFLFSLSFKALFFFWKVRKKWTGFPHFSGKITAMDRTFTTISSFSSRQGSWQQSEFSGKSRLATCMQMAVNAFMQRTSRSRGRVSCHGGQRQIQSSRATKKRVREAQTRDDEHRPTLQGRHWPAPRCLFYLTEMCKSIATYPWFHPVEEKWKTRKQEYSVYSEENRNEAHGQPCGQVSHLQRNLLKLQCEM